MYLSIKSKTTYECIMFIIVFSVLLLKIAI